MMPAWRRPMKSTPVVGLVRCSLRSWNGSNQKWSFPKRQRAVPTSLSTPEQISELTYALTWGTSGTPKFIPLLSSSFDEVIAKARELVTP